MVQQSSIERANAQRQSFTGKPRRSSLQRRERRLAYGLMMAGGMAVRGKSTRPENIIAAETTQSVKGCG